LVEPNASYAGIWLQADRRRFGRRQVSGREIEGEPKMTYEKFQSLSKADHKTLWARLERMENEGRNHAGCVELRAHFLRYWSETGSTMAVAYKIEPMVRALGREVNLTRDILPRLSAAEKKLAGHAWWYLWRTGVIVRVGEAGSGVYKLAGAA
jgi:hypothetical protein